MIICSNPISVIIISLIPTLIIDYFLNRFVLKPFEKECKRRGIKEVGRKFTWARPSDFCKVLRLLIFVFSLFLIFFFFKEFGPWLCDI